MKRRNLRDNSHLPYHIRKKKLLEKRKMTENRDPIVDDVLNELEDYGYFVTMPFDGRLSEDIVEMYLDVDYWLKEGYDKTYRFISSVVGIPSERQFDEFWEKFETTRDPFIEFSPRLSARQGELTGVSINMNYAEKMIEQRYKEGTGYFEDMKRRRRNTDNRRMR